MARAAALTNTASLSAPGFERRIRDARYLVGEDRFLVTFASGKEYSFPRASLEVDDGSDVSNIQVDRRRFFFRVAQVSGNNYEIPWDRVLHEAEPSYPYFRGHMNRTKKVQAVGTTISKLRAQKGITQAQLARAAGMMRANISRIESAKHRPSLDTIEKIARALKVRTADLVSPR